MMEKVMRVAVRIRPLLPAELRQNREVCAHVVADSHQVILAGGHTFPCDFAFGPTVSQEQVYCSSVKPLVASFFAGRDASVLAYGQSGSGKSYTLSGRHGGNDCERDRGVVWRVCKDVFLQLAAKEHTHLKLSASYVAVCGEELRDLLGPGGSQLNLRILEEQNGRTAVEGAVEIPLCSVEDLQNVLKCTSDLNHEHSSSHTLLWLRLRRHLDSSSQDALLSTLLVVDLAGWECESGLVSAHTTRLKRSLQISTELRTLADMIQQDKLTHATPASHVRTSQALSSHTHTHTPCTPLTPLDGSDSPRGCRHTACTSVHCVSAHAHTHPPLVRLLQNSLSGSAQTLLLVCVSPAQSSLTDTVSCLMLAARAQDRCSQTDLRGGHTGPHHTLSVPHRHSPLMHHAAALLEELQDSALSPSLQQRLNAWLDAYKALSPSHTSDLPRCETSDVHQLSADTPGCGGTDAALTQEAQAYAQSLEELKLHCRLQSELLVEQKLLADWLKRDLTASDSRGQRIQSGRLTDGQPAHLTRQPTRCGTAGSGKQVYSHPCNLSLERLSATMKTSNQLLQAQLEEQEEVLRLPGRRRGQETEGKEEADKKDKKRSTRPLLNRTWTRKNTSELGTSTPEPQVTPGLRGVCEGQGGVCETQSVLLSEKELLQKRRDDLSVRLTEGNHTHTEQDDCALHQLEESIEVLDAVMELRSHPDQQRATARQLRESSAAAGSLRVLEDLSLQEAKALFYMYFSKVVCLRERCALQQRRACELGELLSVEREQSSRKLQQLEKEVFFYRSSSRELRRRLRELVQDAPSPPPAGPRASEAAGTEATAREGHPTDMKTSPPA